MDNNTLLTELAAEIRALRRDALQIQPILSEPDVRAVNAGISQLAELLSRSCSASRKPGSDDYRVIRDRN